MRARWKLTAAAVVVAAGVVALASSSSGAPATVQPAFSAPSLATAAHGDPLLIRARAELAAGELSQHTRAELVASDDPAHARARRVLLAMDAPPPEGPAREHAVPESDATQLVVPTLATTTSTPPKPSTPSKPSGSSASETPTVTKPTPSAKVDARPTLSRVALARSSSGATLTLDAGSGVVVGVANQRSSGIVRLLVEARAPVSVLSSRPQVRGARVSTVRRVGRSVFVTLELDPGWSLKRIRKTRHGAKVDLQGPP